MHMLMTLAVLVTTPVHYSNPILNRQLDRWQTLNEQCRGGVSDNCRKKAWTPPNTPFSEGLVGAATLLRVCEGFCVPISIASAAPSGLATGVAG